MRKCLCLQILVLILVNAQPIIANCWKAKIMGEREESRPKIIIGKALDAQSISYPPNPPADKCLIQLISKDLSKRLIMDVREKSEKGDEWILLVNPHGEADLGEPKTCTLRWTLSPGFSLTDYNDNILIKDMKDVSSYDVTGYDNVFQRFKIKYVKENSYQLSTLIHHLQLISGISIPTWEDVNCDKKIDLSDVIYVFRQISEQSQ